MDELHPNEQAKMMRLVAGLDQRLARLEQGQRLLAETLVASEDNLRKLERRLAESVVAALAVRAEPFDPPPVETDREPRVAEPKPEKTARKPVRKTPKAAPDA